MPPVNEFYFNFPKGTFPSFYYPFDEHTRHVIFEKFPQFTTIKFSAKDITFEHSVFRDCGDSYNDAAISASMALISWTNLINEQEKEKEL